MWSTLRLAVVFGCFTAIAFAINEKELTGEEKLNVDEPQYWQAILGDICQLPSFPRATGDPHRYVECVKQNLDTGDRKDLGIWLLRECLPGYEFVASARRCKTTKSIRRQQALCDGPNSTNYQFCPGESNVEFTIQEIRQAPRQCTCPNGENNCVCPTPEILEPISVPRQSKIVRRSPQYSQNLPNCPCPSTNTNCVCLNAQTQTPQVYRDNCCQQQQQPPCLCNDQPQQTPQQSPLLSATQAPSQPQQQYPQQQYPQQQPSVGAPVQSAGCVCPPGTECVCNNQPQQHQPLSSPQQQAPPSSPQQPNCQTTTTQQQYCPQNQQPAVVQPQPCPLVQGGVQNARYQGICSWMIDPLATDPESRSHFLQCQPAPNNLFCGRWQRMPCAPATVFDATSQVCVWDSQGGQPGNLPTPTPYVTPQPQMDSQCGCTGGVQIGSCNANYQCPGQSVCQVGQQSQPNGQTRPCMVCCYYHKKKMI